MSTEITLQLFLATIFGATIGLEREGSNQGPTIFGGIRTYALVGLTGALSGLFFQNNFSSLGLLFTGGFLALLISYYIINSIKTGSLGLTTEISVLLTFLIGLFLILNILPLQTISAIFVTVLFILSLKSKTSKLVGGITRHELQSFISYAIVAIIVLPLLPDISYKLNDLPVLPELFKSLNIDLGQFSNLDLINPRKIWLIVVLITGIDVFGYIISRLVGSKKGFALTSFVAGFISSTSTTQSLAQKSLKTKFVNHLVGAALLANLASFIQIFLLVGPINPKWLAFISPSIFLMILTAGIIGFYYLKQKEPAEEAQETDIKDGKIFSLVPALKFAGLLIIIKIFTKICLILFGQSGFIISSIIASFAGIDAILVNLADMAGQTIEYQFALLTFLIVNATNLLSKAGYSFLQGNRSFTKKFLFGAVSIIFISSTWLIFS